MTEPALDLVIAVHTTARPIRRAVSSVLESAGHRVDEVRVTVVCHEVGVPAIAALLEGLEGPNVRLIPHSDGARSPAGPLNAGVAAATAERVAVMGSDDLLERGAVAAWLQIVDRDDPDILLVPLRLQGGAVLRNPLPRRGRRARLDPARDRLFYRSSPLALIRRSLLAGISGPFLEGMPTGEDLELGAWLWSRPVRIDLAADSPAYVIGADADDRVSTAPHPLRIVLEPVRRLLGRPWVTELEQPVRRALGVKLLRIHVLDALRARPDAAAWGASDEQLLAEVVSRCIALAPGVLDPFSITERRVLEAALSGRGGAGRALTAMASASESSWRQRTLPRELARAFDRESTLTRYLLYRFDRWGSA